MKKTVGAVTLWVTFIGAFSSSAQDFSNKGKDFWVGYGLHCRMFSTGGGSQEMVLYFATEAITTVKVEIPGVGYSQTFSNIAPNTIFTTPPMPKTGPFDARLTTEGIHRTGIHITSDKPIVAYAHIYNGNVSGATLLFPTNTLGKEYYSINFEQHSNEPNSNSFFYAVATDTGTTTIEVIPSDATQSMAGGTAYTYDLTQGQILNVLGILTNANNGVDLTGSIIRSISKNNNGCKRIGVFSGSGKINIHCPLQPSGNSADNYMVQAFPKNAWGKYYLTVPTQNFENNFFRIAVSDPTTVVRLNGTVLTGLINGFYYHFGTTNTPNVIEADKPVMVAQYITSESQCGNGNTGDPEVIYLSPVEQNINKVILNSTQNFAITQHFINVVIPNSGTAVSSFRIDGGPPPTIFISHPRNAGYAYIQMGVPPGQHTLQSDSGFNAIAYGYGSAESYGYNAGSNVKDLYQFISIQNQFATVNFPAGCKNSPFFFYMTFPYQPTKIEWQFFGLFSDVLVNNPVYDSTWVLNGRQLYRYKLPNIYTIPNSGTYPIRVVAQDPITADGCGGEQEIDYDLQVFDRPLADFNYTNNGCATDTVFFIDNSNTGGRDVVKWNWNFGDGALDSVKNTKHRYLAAGSFDVKHSLITDVGCISDTTIKTIVLNDPPVAQFSVSTPNCIGRPVSFTDLSKPNTGTVLVKWYWNFGDGSPAIVANSNALQSHTYTSGGTFTVSLTVETATGCRSFQYNLPVLIHVNPVAAFSFPNVCLPAGTTQFTDQSSITDGTQNLFSYQWNFGDGGTANTQNPVHNYTGAGPYNVSLTVTSNNGCTDDSVRVINTIFAPPQAAFSAPAEVCHGQVVNFTDQSTAPNSSITQWQWNFGDGTSSSTQNPTKTYSNPGSFTVSLTVTSAVGCPSTVTTRTVLINPLPTAVFNVSVPSCVTQNITFTDASVVNPGNLVKWTWDYGDGTNAVLTSGSSIIHTYATTNTYNVTLQVESNKGCKSTITTRPVRISPLPVAGFSMPENCLNDPFSQFTDTSKIADGTQSQFSYLWNFGDPNANAANPNTSSLKNPQHRYTAATNYNVSLTVTSNNGCASSVTKTFTVNGAIPQSAFTVQNGNLVCSNNDVKIINNSSVDFGNVVKLEIYWDYANSPATKIVDDDPQAGKIYSNRYPEFGVPATNNVTIRVVAYSGISCLSASTQVITLQATPTIAFDAINGVCTDVTPFQLTQAREVNNMAGTGTFTGPGVSTSGLFDPSAAKPGTHTIRYTYVSSTGCTNFKDQTLPVFPVPTANAGPDRFMLEGGNITLLGSGNGAAGLSFLWTPATALNSNTVANPKASPVTDIFYTLKVTSREGCSDTDIVFVKVLLAPVIPNAFSPNGDGINDKWEITSLESYPGCTVEVFNRYGQIIYRSAGYSKPWDGNFQNKPVPAGTYYYIVNPKNGRQQLAGFVDVLR